MKRAAASAVIPLARGRMRRACGGPRTATGGYDANFGLLFGILLYLPEMGVLLGGQGLGLAYALGGLANTRLVRSTRGGVTPPKLTLVPAALPRGAGMALSVTDW